MIMIYPLIPSLICLLFTITNSYPLTSVDKASLSQIDRLCSLMDRTHEKRFAVPFPDMNRFLSTSPRVHHDHKESASPKHDFHAYLCSISKDSEEMSNFVSIFIEEHGQPPAFNLFESCEQITKRDQSTIPFNQISQVCSSRVNKRWKGSVAGPMAIDFINQMLEARKVKSYPYSAEMDPYLVGR